MTTSLPRSIFRMLTVSFLLSTFAFAQHYNTTNLLTDGIMVTPAATQAVSDPHLLNPWGLIRSATSPWWISDNNDGSSVLLNATGGVINLNPNGIVSVPNGTAPGTPTGIVFNSNSANFLVNPKVATSGAAFIFVTEDGTILGWNAPTNKASAVVILDHSKVPNERNGAVYKGATLAGFNGKPYLYVTNFRSGRVEVYDTSWNRVRLSFENFHDFFIPRGYAPFNIQAIGQNIYVTYAKQDSDRHDDDAGPGRGFVNVFNTAGVLQARLQHGPWLDSPWGVALAPSEFGFFSHSLLVGNFGSGKIAAFNPATGMFEGWVLNADGSVFTQDGLWGLMYGNGGTAGPLNTLYFTAGPNGEADGVFGTLTPVAAELSAELQP